MIIFDNDWNLKEEITTTQFWLMTKIVMGWEERWQQYLTELRDRLISKMTVVGPRGSEADKAKKEMAHKEIKKLELRAWRELPSEFNRYVKMPRILRH